MKRYFQILTAGFGSLYPGYSFAAGDFSNLAVPDKSCFVAEIVKTSIGKIEK